MLSILKNQKLVWFIFWVSFLQEMILITSGHCFSFGFLCLKELKLLQKTSSLGETLVLKKKKKLIQSDLLKNPWIPYGFLKYHQIPLYCLLGILEKKKKLCSSPKLCLTRSHGKRVDDRSIRQWKAYWFCSMGASSSSHLVNIFSPILILVRAEIVCKRWRSIIKTQIFLSTEIVCKTWRQWMPLPQSS